ncbi:hypothetical protein HDU83_005532 [Entophlyctis luteolus]|nr:hypothetical protein HDU83_005532 [Entophlyctis luteolus]
MTKLLRRVAVAVVVLLLLVQLARIRRQIVDAQYSVATRRPSRASSAPFSFASHVEHPSAKKLLQRQGTGGMDEKLEAVPILHRPLRGNSSFTVAEIAMLCHSSANLAVTRTWAVQDGGSRAMRVETYMAACYPIEIVLPLHARSYEACVDVAMYIAHAHARLSPAIDDSNDDKGAVAGQSGGSALVYADKASKCPLSTFLHHRAALWPPLLHLPNVRNWWVVDDDDDDDEDGDDGAANIAAAAKHVQRVICEGRSSCERVAEAAGRFRKLTVSNSVDIRHIAGDMVDLQTLNGSEYMDWDAFLYIAGRRSGKDSKRRELTNQLIKCWASNPQWPLLTLVADEFDESIPANVKVLNNVTFDSDAFLTLQTSNGMHICRETQCINDAQSLGALAITIDMVPLNELVVDGVSGVLIKGSENVEIASEEVSTCKSFANILSLDLETRVLMGKEARRSFDGRMMTAMVGLESLKEETLYLMYSDGWKYDAAGFEWAVHVADLKVVGMFQKKWF